MSNFGKIPKTRNASNRAKMAVNAIAISESATKLEDSLGTSATWRIGDMDASTIGVVVMRALSIELLLKSFQACSNTDSKYHEGHSLQKLFDEIPIQMKNGFRDAFNDITSSELNDFLESHAMLFVKWRYLWEADENQVVDLSNLKIFALILQRSLEALLRSNLQQSSNNSDAL
jgi:hypothetical protein